MSGRADSPSHVSANRGQSLLEFALILPILLLFLVGIFDLGRAVYAKTVVSNAAREGARKAIVRASDSDIRTAVGSTAVAVYSSDPQVFSVTISPSPSRTLGDMVTVTVCYAFTAATPMIGDILGSSGRIVLCSSSKMVVE